MPIRSFWLIHGILIDITTPSQSGTVSNGNERTLHTPQISISECSSATTPGQSEPKSNGNIEVLRIPQMSSITRAEWNL